MDRSLSLNNIRAHATQLFVILTWAHVAVAGVVSLVARNPWPVPVSAALVVAILATVAARFVPDGLTLRSLMAIFMTCGPILFVYAGRGHASGMSGAGDWQIDYHMYFFAVFAMLAAYVDWRPIAVAAALTAVHHLVLDIVLPANVFPEEGLDRVLLHALAVVAECGVLFWLTIAVNSLFQRMEEAQELVDFTMRETSEALRTAQKENAELQLAAGTRPA